jgi:hypothetical protein
MTTPQDFDFLTASAPGTSDNGNGGAEYPPPLPESEIAQLLQYVPHGQMYPALTRLAGHFAARLGPRLDEILAIIEPATARWEQPVDLAKVRATIRDVVEMERQKRAEREAAPPYDDEGHEETVVEPGTEAEPAGDAPHGEAGTGKPTKKPAPAVLPFDVVPGPEYMRASFAGADRLVPGIGLTAGGVGVLSGAGGDGKSVEAINLALGWTGDATMLPEALRPTRPLRMMLFMVEDAPGMVQERLRLMLGTAPAPSNLLLFTRQEPMQFGGSKGRPLLKALDRLAVTLARHAPVDVVGFDPLVYLHQAEENSASEMMKWLTPFREVCRHAGAALFIVHHAGWAPDGEDARGRGSTAIRAWSDCELSLRAQTKGGKVLHRLNLVKCNFAPRWKETLTLELDPDTLRFAVVDEADTLCATDALVAWLTEEHDGEWAGKRADLYQAMCERFGCSKGTAEKAIARAKKAKRLTDEGKRTPLRVAEKGFTDSRERAG